MSALDGQSEEFPDGFSIAASLKDDGLFITHSETSSKLVQRIIMAFSG